LIGSYEQGMCILKEIGHAMFITDATSSTY